MKTALQEFRGLMAKVHREPVGHVQFEESERMFMAGYLACFARIMEATDLPDAEADRVMEAIQAETTGYGKMVGEIAKRT